LKGDPPLTEEPIIKIINAYKYFGHIEAVHDVSIDIDVGEVLVIIGPSGGGKSTLLRCINRLEVLDQGDIIVDGASVVHDKNINKIRAEIGIVFQLFNLFPHLTALENITLAQRVVRNRSAKEAEEIAHQQLQKVGIGEKWNSYPSQLSGGQQQRVAIARSLSMDPKIMLFDEPTSALDPEMIKGVLDVMLDLAEEGMTMVVVSHEMGFVRAAADRIAFLDNGRLVELTTPNELFNNPKTDRTKEFLSQILEH
jgi:polar amino acid transport system ATP-binding protein